MLRLSKFGVLPKRFLKLRNNLVLCVSYIFGQSHRWPGRGKTSASNVGGSLRKYSESKPGDRVATDQFVPAQPDLVPQEKIFPTGANIWGATVFVDCATHWLEIQLIQDSSGESIFEAKNSIERDFMTHGVAPERYHADNGRYTENRFKADCKAKLQSLTFCWVGAHQQNGISESKIKHFTLADRTMLLHSLRHWPEYITTILWQFTLRVAVDRMNNLHIDIEGNSPEMKISKVSGGTTRLVNFHTFGCPVYVLDSRV